MTIGLALGAGLIILVTGLVWWLASQAKAIGRAQERAESVKEANRRLNEATAADIAIRADMASGGLYDDDGHRRD